MKQLIASLVIGIALATVSACGGQQKDPTAGRWEPYAGCNEQQCRSWASACEADCLNAGGSSTPCINQCGTQAERCKEQCP